MTQHGAFLGSAVTCVVFHPLGPPRYAGYLPFIRCRESGAQPSTTRAMLMSISTVKRQSHWSHESGVDQDRPASEKEHGIHHHKSGPCLQVLRTNFFGGNAA